MELILVVSVVGLGRVKGFEYHTVLNTVVACCLKIYYTLLSQCCCRLLFYIVAPTIAAGFQSHVRCGDN